MTRIRQLGSLALSVITIVGVVVVQGIFAHRFQIFHYFDLPLIYCVYYGFTLNRPVASLFIGSGLGLMTIRYDLTSDATVWGRVCARLARAEELRCTKN